MESRVEVGHKPLQVCYLCYKGRHVYSLVNYVAFNFLCEDKEGDSGYFVLNVKQQQG
jgi:hypothetical protein